MVWVLGYTRTMQQAPGSENTPQNIIIRGPNPVGDLVMATASFADVRRRFPQARITLLVRKAQAQVLQGADYYDELVIDDSAAGLKSLWRLAANLRRQRFDLAIVFTNSLRTALMLAIARIPVRVGYAKGGQRPLLTLAVQPVLQSRNKWLPTPMPEIYARLCAAMGIEPGDGWPQLRVTKQCEQRAEQLRQQLGIQPAEPLIGLVPGASFGQSKLWPPAHFAALADRLSERYGMRTMLFNGPGEDAIARDLVAAMQTRPITTEQPIDLDLLKPFIRDLKLLVTTDSGPRHYATAFRVPTVVVMGPTDPRWSGANLERQEVVRHDVPCGPCHKQVCPLDHRCMIGITPEEVLQRIEQLDKRLGIFTPKAAASLVENTQTT
jgi:heptosyltransferase-2